MLVDSAEERFECFVATLAVAVARADFEHLRVEQVVAVEQQAEHLAVSAAFAG